MRLVRGALRRRGAAIAALDSGVVIGVVLSATLITGAILLGSGSSLNFLNVPSALIVFGGTIGATLIHFGTRDIAYAVHAARQVMTEAENTAPDRIRFIVDLAHAVKSQGLLVLERESSGTNDPFLRLALELTVDGHSPDEVRRILETEMHIANSRESRAVQVFETAGGYAPALGLIGTVIGLIQMLSSLQDPATVGPAMAVALVTTFYGAILANLLFLPLSGKLRNRSGERALIKAITVEGMLSIGRQENTIVLEQRLRGFLPGLA